MNSALEIRDVTVRYGRPGQHGPPHAALDGATLSVEAGACVGLVGALGAGTTTLLLCAAGLVGPDSGCVRWFGSHHWNAGRAAYMPPRADAHPYLSVRAWLDFTLTQRDFDGQLPDPDVASVIARTALAEFARVRVGHLTPGVSVRVALAAALLGAPRVVLLDRPFDLLSSPERARLAQVLGLLRADGVTMVVASHDANALAALAPDRLHTLAAGRVSTHVVRTTTLEIDVPLPIEARSRLALRLPSVYRRGRALRVPLERFTPEQVLAECRALGIEVRASRLLDRDERSRRRVAERPIDLVPRAESPADLPSG